MTNITYNIWGFGMMILAFTFIVLSFFLHSTGKQKLSLLLIFLAGLALRIYTSSDVFLHAWDERYHALVAKHLMEHPLFPTLYENPILPFDMHNWTNNHVWVHKQPLPLWTIGLSMHFAGITEFAVRLPSVILSSLGILIMYKISLYFFKKQNTAWIAAFLFCINGLIIELAAGRVATDHSDIFFLFFVQLAVHLSILFVRKQNSWINVLVGMALAAALLSKWLPALIVLPIWALLVYDAQICSLKKLLFNFIIICATATILFLPWQIYIHSRFPLEAAWEFHYNGKHFFEILDGQGGPWHYFLDQIRINYGELIYLPILWACYQLYQDPNKMKWTVLLLWAIFPILFFSFAATKMQAYILFAAPAYFLLTADFTTDLIDYPNTKKLKWLQQLVLLLLFALPIRYCFERVKPWENNREKAKWQISLEQWKEKGNKRAIIFGHPHPIESMFYTSATVYSELPKNTSLFDSLTALHYDVFVMKNIGKKSLIVPWKHDK